MSHGLVAHVALTGLLLLCNLGEATETTAAEALGKTVQVEKTDEGVWFREAGRPVLFYQAKPKSRDDSHTRANYLHPLYDLRGKQILTEDFPDDHRHHRGVFWTWHQTLVNGKGMGDAWTTQRFGWDVVKLAATTREDGVAELLATVNWTSPDFGSEEPFARETVRMLVFPKGDRARFIDLQIRIESLVDKLELGGSNDVKGYGGFSVRVACPADLTFESEDGPLTPQTTAVPGGDWLTISGTYGKQKASVTVLTDTRAPGRHDWILRKKRSMQNPRFPGRKPITVSRDQPLRLHYGLVIHQDKTPERIALWRERFNAQLESPHAKPAHQENRRDAKQP